MNSEKAIHWTHPFSAPSGFMSKTSSPTHAVELQDPLVTCLHLIERMHLNHNFSNLQSIHCSDCIQSRTE